MFSRTAIAILAVVIAAPMNFAQGSEPPIGDPIFTVSSRDPVTIAQGAPAERRKDVREDPSAAADSARPVQPADSRS